jgi:RND family efflux transporter MFP subunit
MKQYLVLSALAILLFSSCGSNSKENGLALGEKKAALEKLKSQKTTLEEQIKKMEGEIDLLDSTKAGAQKPKLVSVQTLQLTSFDHFIELQGRIDAENISIITPRGAPGQVKTIFVQKGSYVKKGQLLMKLDDAIVRQNIAAALQGIESIKTQLSFANNIYQRQKNLWDQKIGTEVQYLSAKTQRDGLVRRMRTLQSQAALYRIKSPINGVVDQMDFKVGQAVMPGMPGVRVVNTSNLKAKAMVAESYASHINQGDEVNLIFPDIPDTLNTRLSFAAKTIDQSSRSFSVEVNLPSKSSYRANMVSVLKIVDYKKEKALTVPINAIQKSENGDYVFVADSGKAKKAVLRLGKISEGKAEVLSGLKVGDKVILTGLSDLNEGDLVKL